MTAPLIRGLVYVRGEEPREVLVGDDVARIEEERFAFNVWTPSDCGGESLERSISRRFVVEVLFGLPEGGNHDR